MGQGAPRMLRQLVEGLPGMHMINAYEADAEVMPGELAACSAGLGKALAL